MLVRISFINPSFHIALGINKKDRNLKSIENVEFLNPGTILKEAKILFKKIENDN